MTQVTQLKTSTVTAVEAVDVTQARTGAAEEHMRPVEGRMISWASGEDFEQEIELLKNRNWLTEDLIAQAQRHWHCSRLQAVKYMLRGLDEGTA